MRRGVRRLAAVFLKLLFTIVVLPKSIPHHGRIFRDVSSSASWMAYINTSNHGVTVTTTSDTSPPVSIHVP